MISFTPLQKAHFPLLLKWLQTPHVKMWWDAELKWDLALIEEKYSAYIQGTKPVHAFIINVDHHPVGYIQSYNVQDFPVEKSMLEYPENCAALDFYIAETDYLKKGIGSNALKQFMKDVLYTKYHHIIVDPDPANLNAIKTYQKAGFEILKSTQSITWMSAHK
jgi:aminoglycoside 6'-N-acetyltransferase